MCQMKTHNNCLYSQRHVCGDNSVWALPRQVSCSSELFIYALQRDFWWNLFSPQQYKAKGLSVCLCTHGCMCVCRPESRADISLNPLDFSEWVIGPPKSSCQVIPLSIAFPWTSCHMYSSERYWIWSGTRHQSNAFAVVQQSCPVAHIMLLYILGFTEDGRIFKLSLLIILIGQNCATGG